MKPRVVSLFSGIGGFDLAFEREGFQVVAQVELDRNCRKLLSSKWPNLPLIPDIHDANASNLPACDILCGGWPCQDLSVAGKRAGLNGHRSGLFYELARIVDELRPRYFLGENVPGIFSSDGGRDFARVLGTLGELGAVDIAWATLDAQFFGLAQRRNRVFIVADFGGQRAGEILSLSEGVRGNPAPSRQTQQRTAPTLEGRAGTSGCNNVATSGGLEVAGPLGSHAEGGFRNDLDSNGAFVVGSVSSRWAKGTGGPAGDECYNLVSHTLQAAHDASEDGTSRGTPLTVVPILEVGARTGQSSTDIRAGDGIGNAGDPMFTLQSGKQHAVATPSAVRRLTPTETLRLQGFPDDWFNGLNFSDSTKYRCVGNAVAVPVVQWIARRMLPSSLLQSHELPAP